MPPALSHQSAIGIKCHSHASPSPVKIIFKMRIFIFLARCAVIYIVRGEEIQRMAEVGLIAQEERVATFTAMHAASSSRLPARV